MLKFVGITFDFCFKYLMVSIFVELNEYLLQPNEVYLHTLNQIFNYSIELETFPYFKDKFGFRNGTFVLSSCTYSFQLSKSYISADAMHGKFELF